MVWTLWCYLNIPVSWDVTVLRCDNAHWVSGFLHFERSHYLYVEGAVVQDECPAEEKWGNIWATNNFTVTFIYYLTALALAVLLWLIVLEDGGHMVPWSVLDQWHSITSQKTRTCSNMDVRTSNLVMMNYLLWDVWLHWPVLEIQNDVSDKLK
jgi:hypothetical protein